MDIVAQILSEEPGRTEQEEYQISDLPSALQPTSSGDRKHVTLYPGNYADEFTTQSGNGIEIEIPINVSVTILPGAIVEYTENYRNQKFESGNVTYEGDVIEATDGSGNPKHPLSPDQSSTVGVGDVESDEAYFRYKAPEFTGHVENISDLNLASDWAFKQDFERSLWFVRSTDQPNEEPFPVPFENVVEFGAGENIDITVSELSGSPDKGPNVLIDHSDIVTSGQYVEELNPQDPETRFFVENEDTSRVIQNLEIDDGHVTNVDSLEIVESVEAVDDGLEVSSPEGTNNRGNIKIQHNTDGREVDKTALNVSDTGFPAGDGFVVEEVFTDGQGHVTDVDYQPNVTDLTDGFLVKAEHLGPSDPGTYEIAHQTIDIEGSPQNSGTTVIQSVRPFVEQGGSEDETGHIDRVETIDIVGSQGISTATDANNNIEIGLDAQVSENISLATRSIGQSSSDLTLDASEHRVFEFEPTADIDVDITGLPTSRRTRTYLAIKNGGQQNVTFKADGQEGKWNWVDGTRPNLGTPTTTGNTFDLSSYSTTGNTGAVGTTYARNALSIRWGPNGNTLFTPLVDEFGDATPFGEFIELYDASNPYDITNLSSSGNRLDISSQVGNFGDGPTPITDLAFNDDGTKVYVSDSAQGQVVSFSLNSAYGSNGSVANTVDTTSSPPGGSSHTVTPRGVEFGDSGSVLIVSGVDGGTGVINSYALGTPYDISTIQSSKQADVSADESDPTTPRFNANGTKLFVGGEGSGGTPTVTSFMLSAPYDISTLSFENSLATGTGEVTGIDFTPNGSELHVLDITGSPNFDNESITEFGASTSTVPSIDIVSVHQRGGEVYADSGSKANSRFVSVSGDSMSGDLTFTGGVDDSFNNQVARNIIFDSDAPTNTEGNNGDVWMDFGDPTPEVVTSISGGTSIIVTQNTGAVTVSHGMTGGAASTSNSNGNVVQDISFDTRGHATSVQSTNLDNRYYTQSSADGNFVNESGDTMTGDLTIADGNNLVFDSTNQNGALSNTTGYKIKFEGQGLEVNGPTPRLSIGDQDGNDGLDLVNNQITRVGSMDANGPIDVNNSADNYSIQTQSDIRSEADVIASYTSDLQHKTNVKTVESALDKVDQINGIRYDWNDEFRRSGTEYGLPAQEVQKVLPEAVTERKDGSLALDYKQVIPLLTNAIKELREENGQQSEIIDELRNQIK